MSIYGYDYKSNDLCADAISCQTFGASGRRNKYEVAVGKTLSSGTIVNLEDLYQEKVDSSATDFGSVSWSAYLIKYGEIDYSSPVNISGRTFTFEYDIAIVYSSKYSDGTKTCVVELRQKEDPLVSVKEGTYDANAVYNKGNSYILPEISVSWLGKYYSYTGIYFPDAASSAEDADPLYIAVFSIDDSTGLYTAVWRSGNSGLTFDMLSTHMIVMYVITNKYGEIYCYEFEYYTENVPICSITADSSEIYSSAISYNESGSRSAVNITLESETLSSIQEIKKAINKYYLLSVSDGDDSEFYLYSYVIVSAEEYYSGTIDANDDFNKLIEIISEQDYIYIYLEYRTSYGDKIVAKYIYNISFNGRADISGIVSYENYFTDETYVFNAPAVLSYDTTVLGEGTLNLQYSTGTSYANVDSTAGKAYASVTNIGYSYQTVFPKAGDFRLLYSVILRYDENNQAVFAENTSVTLTFYYYFTVYDYYTDMTITYITDAAHPFSDSISSQALYDEEGRVTGYSYTVSSFSLANGNPITLNRSVFATVTDGARFYAWSNYATATYTDIQLIYLPQTAITDFIGEFNSRNVTLYALWDYGLRVTSVTDGESSVETVYLTVTVSGNTTISYIYNLTEVSSPSGYVHKGWLVTYSDGSTEVLEVTASIKFTGDIIVEAIFKQLLTVIYDVNSEFSMINISRSTNIVDGSLLGEVLSSAKLEQLNNITITNSDFIGIYEFKYWAVLVDNEYIEFDLYSDEILASYGENGVVTLYAIYGLAEN